MPRAVQSALLGLASPVVFVVCFRTWGAQAAIASAIAVAVIQGVIFKLRRGRLSPVFVLPAALTLLFGGLELAFASLNLYRYQAFAQNGIVALVCAAAAAFRLPLLSWLSSSVSELAGLPLGGSRAHVKLTAVWAAYFAFKALLYLELAQRLRLDTLVLVRTGLGTASFLGLAAYSFIQTRARPQTKSPA